jgi:hypothetical protein
MSSTLSSPVIPQAFGQQLAELCLEHVAQERAQLEATLAALRDVRVALLGKDHTALGAALARHQTTAASAEEMVRLRNAFQRAVAGRLGVSAKTVTLELLIAHLPQESADQLAEARTSLRGLAAEVEQLNSSNAALVYYCLDFLRRFFDRLTGCAIPGRYGPTGAPSVALGNPLLSARG